MRATRRNRSLKLLDRYVGVPLVSLLGVLPRRRMPAFDTVRRIGVLKSAAIGDTLLLSGPLQDLRRAYPHASISLVTGPDNRAAAAMLGVSAEPPIVVSPVAPLAAVRAIRREHFDLLIDFGSWPRFDAMLAALSGARFRVGFRTRGQGRHSAYDRTVGHSDQVHELDNYRRLVAAVGATGQSPAAIALHAVPSSLPQRMPASPYVVFHPWSGGYRHEVKEWPAERWVELAARVRLPIVVTAGPGDMVRATALVSALSRAGHEATVGAFALEELPHVLAASEVVVSVNTGVMHLAALVGARTVSLEGPVSVARWGPIGRHVRAVKSTFDGCGYLSLGFEYEGHRSDCMNGVLVDAVHAAVRELLEEPH